MNEAKPWTRKRILRVALVVAIPTCLVLAGGAYAVIFANLFHAHEHCIKQLGTQLRLYSIDHDDKFPCHTNGFGDALVACLKHSEITNQAFARVFTAPDDDAHLLIECLKTGAHLPEERCTRAYVQGLSETNNPGICLMFDRYPTRGGDHGRSPWGSPQREVCMLDGSMQKLLEQNWPKFRADQIELLVTAGIQRETAEKLYAPYPRK